MKVSAINNHSAFTHKQCDGKKCNSNSRPMHINPLAATGWIAAAGMGTALFGGIFHRTTLHKIAAFTGAIAIGAHVGLALAHKHPHHKDIVA